MRWNCLIVVALLAGCGTSQGSGELEDDAREAGGNGGDVDAEVAPDLSGDSDAGSPEPDGPDAPDESEPPDTDDPRDSNDLDSDADACGGPSLCIDCMCHCPNGDSVPYGGCFGPCEEIPPEVQSCGADCDAICPWDCPAIGCEGVLTHDCPYGLWRDEAGCETCVCAPPPGLRYGRSGGGFDPEWTSFSGDTSYYIGGINRWILDLAWSFDIPEAADDAHSVQVTLGLQDWDEEWPAAGRTWFHDDPQFETRFAEHTMYGIGVFSTPLDLVSGYLSVRRVGGRFVGGVELELKDVDGTWTESTWVAAPFDLPAP